MPLHNERDLKSGREGFSGVEAARRLTRALGYQPTFLGVLVGGGILRVRRPNWY